MKKQVKNDAGDGHGDDDLKDGEFELSEEENEFPNEQDFGDDEDDEDDG